MSIYQHSLVLLLVALSPVATAQWNGYINKKTHPEKPYGYIATVDTNGNGSKLKLVCLAPDQFAIYLDNRVTDNALASEIRLSVDALPALQFQFSSTSAGYKVSSNSSEFQTLIEQMSVGALISVSTGIGTVYNYSLFGFTQSYINNCAWLDSAGQFQLY